MQRKRNELKAANPEALQEQDRAHYKKQKARRDKDPAAKAAYLAYQREYMKKRRSAAKVQLNSTKKKKIV